MYTNKLIQVTAYTAFRLSNTLTMNWLQNCTGWWDMCGFQCTYSALCGSFAVVHWPVFETPQPALESLQLRSNWPHLLQSTALSSGSWSPSSQSWRKIRQKRVRVITTEWPLFCRYCLVLLFSIHVAFCVVSNYLKHEIVPQKNVFIIKDDYRKIKVKSV